MMGKTHLAVGLAVSLAVVQADTPAECVTAVIGGAVGGVLADVDMLDEWHRRDNRVAQISAWALTAVAVLTDRVFHLGMCGHIADMSRRTAIGLAAFVILAVLGVFTSHRRFTHSLTAAAMYGAAVWLIYEPLLLPFAVAYASHLLLDLTNRKDLLLLYPLPFRWCLKWCYAESPVNRPIATVGAILSVVFLMCSLIACMT